MVRLSGITQFLSQYDAPFAVAASFAGFIACFFVSWHSWELVLIFVLLSFLFLFALGWYGISIGYHRYLSHITPFKTYQWMKAGFAIVGIMAFIGVPRGWTATHRPHHAKSDREGDPHSPVYGFMGRFAKLRGFFSVQMGWVFEKKAPCDQKRWAPDLLDDKVLLWVERWSPLWMFLSLALPALAGGVITELVYGFFWHGTLLGFLSAGLGRTFFLYHCISLVNSYGHMFGPQRFRTEDNSRNAGGIIGWILSFVTGGEINQNSHHAFPWSARLILPGDKGIDMGWHILKLLKWCGLVWDLKEPTPEQIKAAEHAQSTV